MWVIAQSRKFKGSGGIVDYRACPKIRPFIPPAWPLILYGVVDGFFYNFPTIVGYLICPARQITSLRSFCFFHKEVSFKMSHMHGRGRACATLVSLVLCYCFGTVCDDTHTHALFAKPFCYCMFLFLGLHDCLVASLPSQGLD